MAPDQRKPVSRASVELLFDNSLGRAAGQWSQYAEISIKRVLAPGPSYHQQYPVPAARYRRPVSRYWRGHARYAVIEQG